MSKKRYYISLICLLMLCTTIYGAEIVTTTHDFHAMSGDKAQIEFSNSNRIAKTPLLTYTCNDKAKFGLYTEFSPSPICILMSEPGATVTTTQIDNLRQLVIHYYYEGKEPYDADEITISISVDGRVWNAPDEIIYNKGLINVVLPAGDYFLKIARKTKNFYIHQIKYTTEKCACFPYIKPE
ncbi:MAG: hypothetical protein U0K81_04155 [Paludibacteraceae bacterium]|nr:hypothetical protein [Paludibacteraceae bacterium]